MAFKLPTSLIRPPRFSPSEIRVLNGVLLGHKNEFIAAQLGISVHTVKAHVKALLNKVGSDSRHEMALLCFAHPQWFKEER